MMNRQLIDINLSDDPNPDTYTDRLYPQWKANAGPAATHWPVGSVQMTQAMRMKHRNPQSP
jgi:hypothetical protein